MLLGCFDVKTVTVSTDGGIAANHPALLIDDFEDDQDNNRLPSNPNFGVWRCSSYGSPDTPAPKCGNESPGADFSNYAYYDDFSLVGPPGNGKRDYPGVSLSSHTTLPDRYTTAPLDFSIYDRLVFSAALDDGDSSVSAYVYLECSTVSAEVPLGEPFFISSPKLLLSPGWQKYPLELSDFQHVTWNGAIIDEQACLRLVDNLRFDVQPDLVDGASYAGKMTIDNVYLQ